MPPNNDSGAAWRTVDTGEGRWGIAEEAAVEIGFGGQPWTVMMASPLDLADLALGLAFTEGLMGADDLPDVAVKRWPEGWSADIALDPDRLAGEGLRKRNLDGVTGCGLCGVETLAEALRRPPGLSGRRPDIADAAVVSAFDTLPALQPLNAETRTVHAAAWCRPDGEIAIVREDVGRHNALDKLVGALLRDRRLDEDGFVVMTSRCSFELVAKAARTCAGALVTLSAPTGMAIDLAASAGLPLACRAGTEGVIWFGREDAHAGR